MVKTDINVRGSKIAGNALCIAGAVAAPFTFGISLLATGGGIAINMGSTFIETSLLAFYVEKAKEELIKYHDIQEKLNYWEIDWLDVVQTLGKTAIDSGFLTIIKSKLPEATWKMINGMPKELFLKILKTFQIYIKPYYVRLTLNIPTMFTCTTLKACTQQFSSKVAGNIAKIASKKALITFATIAVVIDVAEIIYIWKKDQPQAIKQVQAAIKELEKNQWIDI